ncbi:hypothetical protein KKB28_04525, partial [bacterium]|nr:hypothetical protein [bacterium]
IFGPYYVYVKTDWNNQVFEHLYEDNNVQRSDTTIEIKAVPWPDLVVTEVDIPDSAGSGDTVNVEWTVQNQGPGNLPNSTWTDAIYFSAFPEFDPDSVAMLGTFDYSGSLAPSASYIGQGSIVIPNGIEGPYYVYVQTDLNDQVFEHLFEDNNVNLSDTSIQISLTPWPDLAVTEITIPDSTNSGDTVNVEWTVQNQGPGNFENSSWIDGVFLSTLPDFDPDSAVLLNAFDQSGSLDSNANYMGQGSVVIPDGIEGSFYIYIWTDLNDQIYEYLFEDNNVLRANPSVQINLSPWPDLIVTTIEVPPDGVEGQSLSIEWTVQNSGPGWTGATSWVDSVYLGVDPELNPETAYLLGSFVHSGALSSDSTYSVQDSILLPENIFGQFYLYIVTDADDQVYEYLYEDNNILRSDTSIQVDMSPWPDLEVTTIQIPQDVDAGQDLPVTFTVSNSGFAPTDTSSWTDRIYLSANPVWNLGSATLLDVIQHAGILDTAADYTEATSVAISSQISGTFYIYVQVDADSEVFEHIDEGNNILRSAELIVHPYPVDIAVTEVVAPDSGFSGQSLNLQWTVFNIGSVPTLASSWQDAVYLSLDSVLNADIDALLTTVTHLTALTPGQSYTRERVVTIPNGISDSYYIIVKTDVNNQIGDINLENNTGASESIIIQLTPPSDLQIADFFAPSQGTAGQPLMINWMVFNAGIGETYVETWYDAIWLSANTAIDGSDTRLGTLVHNGSLQPDSTYSDSLLVEIPNYVSGNYYLILRTDNRDDLYEHEGEDNNTNSRPISVYLPAPADLIVTQITLPDSATPGDEVLVSWTIENVGANPAVGWMRDAVYFSPDTLWDINDALLGFDSRNINIAPGGSMRMSCWIDLSKTYRAGEDGEIIEEMPGVPLGSYHAIIRTDIRNNIPETDNSNNTSASLDTIEIDLPELQLGVPETGHLASGQMRYYRVEIAIDLDLQLILDADESNSVNEIYIAFNRVPTLADHDYVAAQPFSADQELLVPSTQAGNYYVLLLSRTLATDYTLTADALPFSILSITPDAGGAGGRVTCLLRGAGFRDSIQVFLQLSPDSLLPGEFLEYVNTTEQIIRWDLEDVPLGSYDVIAVNTDSSTVQLVQGFTVEPLLF